LPKTVESRLAVIGENPRHLGKLFIIIDFFGHERDLTINLPASKR